MPAFRANLPRHGIPRMRLATVRGIAAVITTLLLVACAAPGPRPESPPAQPESEQATTQTAGPQAAGSAATDTVATPAAPGLLLLVLDPALRGAVGDAIRAAEPAQEFVFEGDSRAAEPHRTLQLDFTSLVDRSGQRRNQDGAVIGGLATLLLGSITPWSCPVTHALNASLTAPDGSLLHAWDASVKDKHVGTMLMCPDVDKPEKDALQKLARELMQRMRADGFLVGS